jgi:hypothetical protein
LEYDCERNKLIDGASFLKSVQSGLHHIRNSTPTVTKWRPLALPTYIWKVLHQKQYVITVLTTYNVGILYN